MSSSNNKLDKTGLAYFWNKASAYIQETIEYAQQLWVKIGNTSMGTTAQTLTGAIKQIVDKIGNTSMGTTATTITGAIAEHEGDISNLNSNFTNPSVVRKSVSANVMTTVNYTTITAGTWLLIGWIELEDAPNSMYYHDLDGIPVRNNGTNGGGSCITIIKQTNSDTTVKAKAYIPIATTVRSRIYAIKLR